MPNARSHSRFTLVTSVRLYQDADLRRNSDLASSMLERFLDGVGVTSLAGSQCSMVLPPACWGNWEMVLCC